MVAVPDCDTSPLDKALVSERADILAHPSGIVGVAEALEVSLVDYAEAPDVLEGVDLGLSQAILWTA